MGWTLFGIWVAVGLTFVMYSFLYKDNPLFKFGEHLYLGVSMGYFFVRTVFVTLKQKLWMPTMIPVLNKMRAPDGETPDTLFERFANWATDGYPKGMLEAHSQWWLVIPLILGILVYMRLSSKLAWMSRYTFAFIVGFGSGLSIPPTISASLLQQLWGTAKPLMDAGNLSTWALVSQGLIILGVVCTVVYFLFSIEHKGPLRVASRIGIYFIMISFGATFGYTVMGRMSLFVGRLQVLMDYSKWDAAYLRENDLLDGVALTAQMTTQGSDATPSPGRRISELMSQEDRTAVAAASGSREELEKERRRVLEGLNRVIEQKDLYNVADFGALKAPSDIKPLLEKYAELPPRDLHRANRRLLEVAYPGTLAKAADVSPYGATWVCLALVLGGIVAWEVTRTKQPNEGGVH